MSQHPAVVAATTTLLGMTIGLVGHGCWFYDSIPARQNSIDTHINIRSWVWICTSIRWVTINPTDTRYRTHPLQFQQLCPLPDGGRCRGPLGVSVSNQHWWVNLCMHVLVTDGVLSGRNSYTGSRLISLLQPSVARATHIWLLVVRDYKWARERERFFQVYVWCVWVPIILCVFLILASPLLWDRPLLL